MHPASPLSKTPELANHADAPGPTPDLQNRFVIERWLVREAPEIIPIYLKLETDLFSPILLRGKLRPRLPKDT